MMQHMMQHRCWIHVPPNWTLMLSILMVIPVLALLAVLGTMHEWEPRPICICSWMQKHGTR